MILRFYKLKQLDNTYKLKAFDKNFKLDHPKLKWKYNISFYSKNCLFKTYIIWGSSYLASWVWYPSYLSLSEWILRLWTRVVNGWDLTVGKWVTGWSCNTSKTKTKKIIQSKRLRVLLRLRLCSVAAELRIDGCCCCRFVSALIQLVVVLLRLCFDSPSDGGGGGAASM